MDLHHQPVIEAHARHLGQHLAAEQVGLGRHLPLATLAEQRLGLGLREIGGARGRMAVVGRGRAAAP